MAFDYPAAGRVDRAAKSNAHGRDAVSSRQGSARGFDLLQNTDRAQRWPHLVTFHGHEFAIAGSDAQLQLRAADLDA